MSPQEKYDKIIETLKSDGIDAPTMTNNTLQPCPFCRDNQVRVRNDTIAYLPPHSWIVLCKCGACGPNKDSSASAIEAWNEHATPSHSVLAITHDGSLPCCPQWNGRLKRLTAALLVLVLVVVCNTPAFAGANWFVTVNPPDGGPSFEIGPWGKQHVLDWCGSALFNHPSACFYHPKTHDCGITGPGFLYPSQYTCVEDTPGCDTPDVTNCRPVQHHNTTPFGFYYVEYAPDQGMVGPWPSSDQLTSPKCDRKLAQAQADGDLVGRYCFCVGPSPSVCRGPDH